MGAGEGELSLPQLGFTLMSTQLTVTLALAPDLLHGSRLLGGPANRPTP